MPKWAQSGRAPDKWTFGNGTCQSELDTTVEEDEIFPWENVFDNAILGNSMSRLELLHRAPYSDQDTIPSISRLCRHHPSAEYLGPPPPNKSPLAATGKSMRQDMDESDSSVMNTDPTCYDGRSFETTTGASVANELPYHALPDDSIQNKTGLEIQCHNHRLPSAGSLIDRLSTYSLGEKSFAIDALGRFSVASVTSMTKSSRSHPSAQSLSDRAVARICSGGIFWSQMACETKDPSSFHLKYGTGDCFTISNYAEREIWWPPIPILRGAQGDLLEQIWSASGVPGWTDVFGNTSLHIAAACGARYCQLQAMMERDNIRACNAAKQSFMHVLNPDLWSAEEMISLRDQLVREGFDFYHRDLQGRMFFDILKSRGWTEPTFLDHEIDSHLYCRVPSRKLMEAAEANAGSRLDRVEHLISIGVDVNGHDHTGSTPLMAYLRCVPYHQPIIDKLLRYGADPDARDSTGMSALHIAIKLGNIEATKSLLSRGANVHARDQGCKGLLVVAERAQRRAIRGDDVSLYAKITACMALVIDAGATAFPNLIDEWRMAEMSDLLDREDRRY